MDRELVFFCMYSGKKNKKQFCSISPCASFSDESQIYFTLTFKKTKQNIGLLNFLKLGLRKPDWVSRHWPIFSGCHRNNLNRAKQQMFSVFSHDSYNLYFFLSSL